MYYYYSRLLYSEFDKILPESLRKRGPTAVLGQRDSNMLEDDGNVTACHDTRGKATEGDATGPPFEG